MIRVEIDHPYDRDVHPAFLGITVWNANYTIQTAAIVLAGLLILFTSMRQKRSLAWLFAGTLIISFGFMLRIESALLFLPFIALEVLSGFFSAEKNPGLSSVIPINGNEDTAFVPRFSFWTRFHGQTGQTGGQTGQTGQTNRLARRRSSGVYSFPAAVIIFSSPPFALICRKPIKPPGVTTLPVQQP